MELGDFEFGNRPDELKAIPIAKAKLLKSGSWLFLIEG